MKRADAQCQRIGSLLGLLVGLGAWAAPPKAPPTSPGKLVPPIGVYAVWHGTRQDVFEPTAVVGGQVWAQWADVEPTPGHYDFTLLERRFAAVRRSGRRATVQINANLHPDWLFEQVPFLPVALRGVKSPRGTPMYWHPAYLAAQLALIDALGDWIAEHPDREAVSAVRLSFNGVGTEGLGIPADYRQASAWQRPPGVNAGSDWSPALAQAYAARIVDHYIDRITPVSFLLVRRALFQEGTGGLGSSAEGARLRARLEPLMDAGRVGIFHTSSDIQPRNRGYSRDVYRTMRSLCRDQRRICYAEAITTAGSRRTEYPTTMAPSAAQWSYWRVLSDLSLGITRLAVNRRDLIRWQEPGFSDGLAFAERYLGAHISPSASRGAWLAFRAGDFLDGDYAVLADAIGCGERHTDVGPSEQPYGLWATRLSPGDGCEIHFDDSFIASTAGQHLRLNVIAHKAPGEGASTLGLTGLGARPGQVTLAGDRDWQSLTLDITPSPKARRTATLILEALGGNLHLHRIELQRSTTSSTALTD